VVVSCLLFGCIEINLISTTSSPMRSSPRDNSTIHSLLVISTDYATSGSTVCSPLVTGSLAVRMVMTLSHAILLLLHGIVVFLISNIRPSHTHSRNA